MRTLIVGVIVGSILGGSAYAELPTYAGRHVNDFDQILTPAQGAALEQKVMNIENTVADHPQVFVILVNKLPADEDIDSYKNKVFHAWGIGQKNVDNGVLLVIAKTERKAGIEVGYGAEHRITDAEVHALIDAHIKPNLTRGSENWYKATDDTVDAIGVDLAKTAEPVVAPANNGGSTLLVTLLGISALGWLTFALLSRRGRKRREALIQQARASREETLRQAGRAATVARPPTPSPSYRTPSSPYRPPSSGRAAATGVAAGVVAGTVISEAERRRRRNAASSSTTTSSTDYSSSPSTPSPSSDSSSSSSSSSSGGGGDSGGGGGSDSF